MRESGYFGDVLVTAFHHTQLLGLFGVLDPFTPINNVIYDEVDVFYNNHQLD